MSNNLLHMSALWRGLSLSIKTIILSMMIALFSSHPALRGYTDDFDMARLETLSVAELFLLDVSTASRKDESLFDTPAAVYVITGEDIRRSGARSIPEALRLAPGVHVARIDANKWAISIRGFTDRFSNKLLVLMDGRVVYTPLFGGVFWEVQDTLLEDIDRIEVIRGPGATLWSPNAVNGVINIITKSAKETKGGYVEAGVGTEKRGFAGARYGGRIGDDLYYRVWGKFFNRDDQINEDAARANDNWRAERGGFRMDWKPNSKDSVTFQSDIYYGEYDETVRFNKFTPPFFEPTPTSGDFSGGYLLARWTRDLGKMGETTIQSYYDRTNRDNVLISITRNTYEFDFQHRFGLWDNQDIVWGLATRVTWDKLSSNGLFVSTDDPKRTDYLFSGFFEDEIAVSKDRVYLILGSKFEYNSFSGFEIQPTARALFIPHKNHRIWASISRAVRVPSRTTESFDLNVTVVPLPGDMAGLIRILPNEELKSEELLAFEVGYRTVLNDWISVDIAAFLNVYDNLASRKMEGLIVDNVGGMPVPVALFRWVNEEKGKSFGVEFASQIQPFDFWTLALNYTYLNLQIDSDESSTDISPELFEDRSPSHQASIRSHLELPQNIEFDSALYYVDGIDKLKVSDYLRLDLRLGWRPVKNLELSVVGQNLLDGRHAEFKPGFFNQFSEVQRSVYAMASWKF